MSGGKRYKFQGSTIAVVTGFHGDSPSSPITNITRANPAVVTESAHGRVDGAVVKIQNVVGMTEVNDEVFIINVLTSSTYELIGVDSSGYGAYVSGGIVDQATFSNFCELTNYNRQGGSKPEIDATTVCSTAAEYELGLPDFGTTQMDFNFAPQTAIQQAIAAFDASGDKLAVKVTLPRSGGIRTLLGFIQQTSEQAGKNGMWTGSLTIRNTGAPYDQAG